MKKPKKQPPTLESILREWGDGTFEPTPILASLSVNLDGQDRVVLELAPNEAGRLRLFEVKGNKVEEL
jgi:hypothetical protein